MSVLSVSPEIVSAASGQLESLGVALRDATAAATARTAAVMSPATDEGVAGRHGAAQRIWPGVSGPQ